MLIANKKPAITIKGLNTQAKIIITPAKRTKIWKIIPTTIKTVLIIAPKILENVFEISVLKNSEIFIPLGYTHLYLRHGAKKDFNKIGREK